MATLSRVLRALFVVSLAPVGSLAGTAITVDASKPAGAPHELGFASGGKSPDGHTLAINSRYLLRDGRPWFPVMGEFHYSRSAPETWERELLKMKAGGVTVVSTYVFWIHHEELEGKFDWSGRRDLRRFVELAGRHGLTVWVRVGPWDHGEVRNGGLPDWVLAKTKSRTNDPAYLKYVQRFYGEIGRQLHGLSYKDGGPIAGVQIENEYHPGGPDKGKAHILTLLKMAKEAGLDAPFFTVTAWDDAVVPSQNVIPVFGGYPDGFWYRSYEPLAPSPDYFFSSIRRDETVDDHLKSMRPETDARYAEYPFLTAEMGGGMAVAYHRRPVMSADDIAAVEVAKLGSGVSLYGYYMFHGGTNPDGKLTTLQESQATGYWNDLPLKGYDFQAPLGEFGQMHPSFRVLKSLHLFLSDYGEELAPMAAHFAGLQPASRTDVETPRVAVRSDAHQGYLFVNNYQKDHPLPERRNFQTTVTLADGAVTIPRRPITIPSGAYFFWPIKTKIGGATLEYATAQPLCRLEDPDTAVFFTWPGIDAEFAFRDAEGLTIEAQGAKVTRENGRVYVRGIASGLTAAIRIRQGEKTTQIVVASREQAGNIWKARLGGRDRLVYATADTWFDGDTVHVASHDARGLAFGLYPAMGEAPTDFTKAGANGIFDCYETQVAPLDVRAEFKQVKPAGAVAPSQVGTQKVVALPSEAEFERTAARWRIRVPKIDSTAVGDTLLRIGYEGDIARVFADGRLLTDEFYRGMPWEIGLRGLGGAELELAVLPMRADSPVYIGNGLKPRIAAGEQTARVTSVTVIPLYEAQAEVRH